MFHTLRVACQTVNFIDQMTNVYLIKGIYSVLFFAIIKVGHIAFITQMIWYVLLTTTVVVASLLRTYLVEILVEM